MNKTLLAGLAIIVLVVIAGVAYYSIQPKKDQNPEAVTPMGSNPPSSTTNASSTPQPDLGQGGSSYADAKGIYSVLYPNDYSLDTQDPIHIRIFKRGETQRPQSEMSDGALIVFESVDLGGKTLEEFVDQRIKESVVDGTSEIINPKKAVTQNTYPGFSYTLRGLGESEYLVLQKDKNSKNALFTTYAISDPQQKNYQKDIDSIISSIKLLK